MAITIVTTKSTGFYIAFQSVSACDLVIDWGDGGATSSVHVHYSANNTHDYADSTSKTITITGDIDGITYIQCEDDLISSLDIRECYALVYLLCADNLLTTLDIGGCISLNRVDCDDNPLTPHAVNDILVNLCTHPLPIYGYGYYLYVTTYEALSGTGLDAYNRMKDLTLGWGLMIWIFVITVEIVDPTTNTTLTVGNAKSALYNAGIKTVSGKSTDIDIYYIEIHKEG